MLVVQLPKSSEEFGDSRDINPAAATSATDRIAEFASASEEVLSAGTFEGPRHGAIIQFGVPLEFLRSEQEEEAVWNGGFPDQQRKRLSPGIARVQFCFHVLYSHFSTCSG